MPRAKQRTFTLAQWLRNPGADTYATDYATNPPRVAIHDSRAIEHIRTYLWDLADYRVECVQAGVIWLAPRDLRVQKRAMYLASLHIGDGRPWTDADHQAFQTASERWDAEHPEVYDATR